MSNVENIKPYSDFSHLAAQHGGVDSYLDELATANYTLGAVETRQTDIKIGVFAIGCAIALWELGKYAYKKGEELLLEHKEKANAKAQDARIAIKAETRNMEECIRL